jgi:SnoaL-like domain
MRDLTATIDTYLAAWNETDASRRAELVGTVWVADGQLIDPPATGEGHAGISDLAAALHAQFPGHVFRRSTAVDAHHDTFRFGWELVGPDGSIALAGVDVGQIDQSGQLQRVSGFFGELPAADAA